MEDVQILYLLGTGTGVGFGMGMPDSIVRYLAANPLYVLLESLVNTSINTFSAERNFLPLFSKPVKFAILTNDPEVSCFMFNLS